MAWDQTVNLRVASSNLAPAAIAISGGRQMYFNVTVMKFVQEVFEIEAESQKEAEEKALDEMKRTVTTKSDITYVVQHVESEE